MVSEGQLLLFILFIFLVPNVLKITMRGMANILHGVAIISGGMARIFNDVPDIMHVLPVISKDVICQYEPI